MVYTFYTKLLKSREPSSKPLALLCWFWCECALCGCAVMLLGLVLHALACSLSLLYCTVFISWCPCKHLPWLYVWTLKLICKLMTQIRFSPVLPCVYLLTAHRLACINAKRLDARRAEGVHSAVLALYAIYVVVMQLPSSAYTYFGLVVGCTERGMRLGVGTIGRLYTYNTRKVASSDGGRTVYVLLGRYVHAI